MEVEVEKRESGRTSSIHRWMRKRWNRKRKVDERREKIKKKRNIWGREIERNI